MGFDNPFFSFIRFLIRLTVSLILASDDFTACVVLIPGQNSTAGKVKSLCGALEIMMNTQCAFLVLQKELECESDQVREVCQAASPEMC